MSETPVSLLERLRQPARQEADWHRFVELYTPMLYYWARRQARAGEDPADLVQEVFVILIHKLPEFVYDHRKQSFRGWLRTVAVHRWHKLRQRQRHTVQAVDEAAGREPEAPDLFAEFEERDYCRHIATRALELIQAEFPATVWRACREYLIADRPPAEVARELGVSVNAVYLAKSRVLARLRQELTGLLD
jgi:RNA polymerase sigma-70 factor (ECF subfamily)